MRFVMINLFLICLLIFGIGYLAFGDGGTVTNPEMHTQPIQELSGPEIGVLCTGSLQIRSEGYFEPVRN